MKQSKSYSDFRAYAEVIRIGNWQITFDTILWEFLAGVMPYWSCSISLCNKD